MDAIFHEKQEGALCAQHCLNALLQGPYFTAVDLAEIAMQLDEKEREQMAEAGTHTESYQQFLQQPSNNYDDSGFFSVQVIETALRVWGLELLPYNSQNELCRRAREDPRDMRSYICNFGEHWLTVRKIGNQWFNLNSLLTGPELLSDTYLSLFLTQLQQDGYSLFIVVGDMSECEADQLLRLCPAVQPIKPQLITESGPRKRPSGAQGGEQNDEGLDKALAQSKQINEADDVSLQRVLQMSMEGFIEESVGRIESACANCDPETASTSANQNPSSERGYTLNSSAPEGANSADSKAIDADEMRKRRLAFLEKVDKSGTHIDNNGNETTETVKQPGETVIKCSKTEENELTEEEMLQQAIALSMSQ